MYSNKKKINVGFGIFANEKTASLDYKYGPYESKEEAFEYLGEDGLDVLAVGLTVGILTENGVEEYWFKKACDSVDDLVPKLVGGVSSEIPEPSPEQLASPEIDSTKEMEQFMSGFTHDDNLKEIIEESTQVANLGDIEKLFNN